MKIKVVMPEGLLDHQQVELIEFLQMFHLLQRVSGVGIATQKNFGPAFADTGKDLYIPPWLAFHLDALITGVHLRFDLFQQLLHGILNADGDAAGNTFARAAQQLP